MPRPRLLFVHGRGQGEFDARDLLDLVQRGGRAVVLAAGGQRQPLQHGLVESGGHDPALAIGLVAGRSTRRVRERDRSAAGGPHTNSVHGDPGSFELRHDLLDAALVVLAVAEQHDGPRARVADRLPVRFQLQLHKLLWGDEPGR